MPASLAGKPLPRIDEELCQACRRCPVVSACRGRAVLRFERDEPPFIDVASCDGCYACIPACPHEAVMLDSKNENRVRREKHGRIDL